MMYKIGHLSFEYKDEYLEIRDRGLGHGLKSYASLEEVEDGLRKLLEDIQRQKQLMDEGH